MSSAGFRAPRNSPEIERQREGIERKKERKKDTGTKALMEQRCFNQHGVDIYTVVILSKDKDYNSRLTKHKMIPIKERVASDHLLPFGS